VENIRKIIREFVADALAEAGHDRSVDDDTSLITGGLLESLVVVNLIVFIESRFGIDFSQIFFDQNMFDTIDDITKFIENNIRQNSKS
jgi:acyl carrier protein